MPEARYRLLDGAVLKRLMRAPEPGGTPHTVHSLASTCGLSASKIRKLIRGARPTVTGAQAKRIARAVGVPVEALFLPRSSSSEDENERTERAMSPEDRTLRASLAAHASHAAHPDTKSRTAKARAAATDRFVREAREMHPDATDEEIARVAGHLSKAHFKRMALASAKSRRAKASKAA